MFSYYGSKSKVVDLYPKPKFNTIIEPFAGSARYSLKYFDRDILLNDLCEFVFDTWEYLINASKEDIKKLPNLKKGQKYSISDFQCIGEHNLFAFICNQGNSYPGHKVSKWGFENFKRQKKYISNNLFKIRHWEISKKNYTNISNKEATWFIDAPYEFGGQSYKHNKIDFQELKNYCLSRNGQLIVCENTKATWMNFHPIGQMVGCQNITTEAIYSNYPTIYENKQLNIFNQSQNEK